MRSVRSLFFLGLWIGSPIFCGPSIVFIHLGDKLPKYLPDAVVQARQFNRDCPIYLIASQRALKKPPGALLEADPILVAVESLEKKSSAHSIPEEEPTGSAVSRRTRLFLHRALLLPL